MVLWGRLEAGDRIRANGWLYDIAANAYLMTTAGGTFTGQIEIDRGAAADWAYMNVHVQTAPTNCAPCCYLAWEDGDTWFGQWNSAKTVITGGVHVLPDNTIVDIKTSGKIWHSGNDGPNSGLDADTLDGYGGAWTNTGNTYALRDVNGYIASAGFIGNNTPRIWCNFDGLTSVLRSWYNVSSLTDVGTGRQRINFSYSLQDLNYCAIASAASTIVAGYDTLIAAQPRRDQRTASRCEIKSML